MRLHRVVTMNDRRDRWIGLINRGVRQRFGRWNRSAFVAEPIPSEIEGHDSYAIRRLQLGETPVAEPVM